MYTYVKEYVLLVFLIFLFFNCETNDVDKKVFVETPDTLLEHAENNNYCKIYLDSALSIYGQDSIELISRLFNSAIKCDSSYYLAWLKRGAFCLEIREFEQAKYNLLYLSENFNENYLVFDMLSEVYIELGSKDSSDYYREKSFIISKKKYIDSGSNNDFMNYVFMTKKYKGKIEAIKLTKTKVDKIDDFVLKGILNELEKDDR